VVSDTDEIDKGGFEAFYRREHGPLGTSLLLVTGDADLAPGGADEAFARALAAWPRVAAMASPGGWTYRLKWYSRSR